MGKPAMYSEKVGPVREFERFLALPAESHAHTFEETITRVCAGWTLRRVAHKLGFPAVHFTAWIKADDRRKEMYEHALKVAAEYFLDKVQTCADEATSDNFQVKRLQIETHKWLAAKTDRQRFGDDKQAPTVQNNITIVHRSE